MILRVSLLLLGSVPLQCAMASQGVDSSFPFVNVLQLLFALAIVLVVIYGAATLFRRFSGTMGSVSSCMKVVSALMVGQRERVIIVELEDEWLVLGVTAHSINLLCRMPRKESTPTALPTDPFARWLKGALSKTRSRQDNTRR